MKLSIMREFVRLAENQNYSKTAEDLFIAQSALSRHIAALEQELGTKLIDRTRNSFALTASGKIVQEEFRGILTDYQNMLDRLARQNEIEHGEIHVGFLYYDMDYYVSKIRDAFRRQYPQIRLILHSYQPEQLEEDLLEGHIDVAMIYGMEECRRTDVSSQPFLKIPCSLMYGKNHRFAAIPDIRTVDFDGEKILYPEAPFKLNHVADTIEKLFSAAGVHIAERIRINNYDEIPWLLNENNAVYLSAMANAHIYDGKVESRFFLPDQYHIDISAVWLKKNDNPAIPLFNAAIRSCYF